MRTLRLKIKNKLRTIPVSELIAQGRIEEYRIELHHVFSMFIKNKILRT